MIKNFKNNTLTDSLVSGAAAIALIAGVGIAATPAQAANFTQDSAIGWSNGTSDFNNSATAVITDDAGGFDVTFSPISVGGTADVSTAFGDFNPFFNVPPQALFSTNSPTGTFNFLSSTTQAGFVDAAEFELVAPLTFEFDTSGVAGSPGSPVTATLPAGSVFLGGLEADGGVEFELESGSEWEFVLPNGADGEDITGIADSSTFTFDQPDGSPNGEYSAGGSVGVGQPVPEPTTILSLLAVGGLGLGLKRKKQSKQLSA